MKCFRTVPTEFGTLETIFSGIGAAQFPGRWNTKALNAIYCSSTLEAVVSERGYHSLLLKIENYNKQIRSKRKNFPASYVEEIRKVKFILAEIELFDFEETCKIETDSDLQRILSNYDMEPKTLSDARRDMYQFERPKFWTRRLGYNLATNGMQQMVIGSARNSLGNTIVIFEENITRANYKILGIHDLYISASPQSGHSIKSGNLVSEDRILFESKIGSGTAEILRL